MMTPAATRRWLVFISRKYRFRRSLNSGGTTLTGADQVATCTECNLNTTAHEG